jgi:transposase-like protein
MTQTIQQPVICPYCKSERTKKSGKNGSGSQRYRCLNCTRRFTPERKAHRSYFTEVKNEIAQLEKELVELKKRANRVLEVVRLTGVYVSTEFQEACFELSNFLELHS